MWHFLEKDLLLQYSYDLYEDGSFNILPIYKLCVIILSIFAFDLLFKKSKENETIIGLAHAMVASMSAVYILSTQHSLFVIPDSYSTAITHCDIVLSISYGYFLWDLYISVFVIKLKIDFVIHATLCCIVYSSCVFAPYFHRPATVVLLYEVSTIFLHFSTLFHEKKRFKLY
eukprot:UN08160